MPERISARMLGRLAMPDFCPRCFWVEMHTERMPFAIPMPGIFSTIDAYGKSLIHASLDEGGALPSWFPTIGDVAGYVRGLHHSRFNHTDEATRLTLTGVPDDVFQMEDSSYAIVDYKTARFTERQDALFPLYEVQLNAYAFIARKAGLSPISSLWLVYMEPQTGDDTKKEGLSDSRFSLHFSATPRPVAIAPDERVLSLMRKARGILDASPPSPLPRCDNCRLLETFMGTIEKSRT